MIDKSPTAENSRKGRCVPNCGNSANCACYKAMEERFKEIFKKINAMQGGKSERKRQTKLTLQNGKRSHLSGEFITRIRQKYQLTQNEFSLILGSNLTSVNRWERGKTVPSRRMIERIITVRDMGCRKVRRILSEKKQATRQ